MYIFWFVAGEMISEISYNTGREYSRTSWTYLRAKSVEDATREIRRLEERLRASEVEKNVAESSRKKLEEEIRRLRV